MHPSCFAVLTHASGAVSLFPHVQSSKWSHVEYCFSLLLTLHGRWWPCGILMHLAEVDRMLSVDSNISSMWHPAYSQGFSVSCLIWGRKKKKERVLGWSHHELCRVLIGSKEFLLVFSQSQAAHCATVRGKLSILFQWAHHVPVGDYSCLVLCTLWNVCTYTRTYGSCGKYV